MTINATIPYWNPPPTPHAERRLRACVSALSKRRHRELLGELAAHDSPLSVPRMAERLVAIEQNTPLADPSPTEIERTQIGLIHVHLPQLEAAGFVTTTSESSVVSLADHPPS